MPASLLLLGAGASSEPHIGNDLLQEGSTSKILQEDGTSSLRQEG